MSKCAWIIEFGLDEDAEQRLYDSVISAGYDAYAVKWGPPLSEEYHGKLPPKDIPVLYYGSLVGSKNIQGLGWSPGTYDPEEKYMEYSYYSEYFSQYLLNYFHVTGKLKDIKKLSEYVLDDTFFVKPNSGRKTFSGDAVHKDNIDWFLQKVYEYDDTSPETPVILSPTKKILTEVRLVIANQVPITYTTYGENVAEFDKVNMLLFANLMAKKYNPSPAWTLDLAFTKEWGWKVLEIGAFSCSGIYNCNTDVIAKVLSKIMIENFKV